MLLADSSLLFKDHPVEQVYAPAPCFVPNKPQNLFLVCNPLSIATPNSYHRRPAPNPLSNCPHPALQRPRICRRVLCPIARFCCHPKKSAVISSLISPQNTPLQRTIHSLRMNRVAQSYPHFTITIIFF